MEQMVVAVAVAAGTLVRWLLRGLELAVRSAPYLLVVYGVQQIYAPAAWIVAGLIIFGLERSSEKRPARR